MFPMLHGLVSQGGGFVGPLDGLSNIAAAYSMRRLLAAYEGNLIRLRRSSDNAESDFGVTGAGDLDTSAITTWLGGANGFVVTWYDQSGSGVNWTQSTALRQPAYAANQTNGKPAMTLASASGQYMSRASSFLGAGDHAAHAVFKKTSDHSGAILFDVQASTNRFYLSVSAANLETRVYRGSFYTGNGLISASNAWHIGVSKVITSSTTCTLYRDGVEGITTAATGFIGTTGCVLGARTDGSLPLNGAIAEVLVFSAAHDDTVRDALESNQGAYYGISVS